MFIQYLLLSLSRKTSMHSINLLFYIDSDILKNGEPKITRMELLVHDGDGRDLWKIHVITFFSGECSTSKRGH